ncbi:MAG: anthranilate synthase component I family protein [Rubrobacteraceae bacterium]
MKEALDNAAGDRRITSTETREVHRFRAGEPLDLAALIPALGLVPGVDPFVLLEGEGWGTSVLAFEPEQHLVVEKNASPFERLRRFLDRAGGDAHPLEGGAGLFGYLSYDAVRHLERLPVLAEDDLDLPDAQFILPRYTVGVEGSAAWVSVPAGEDPAPVARALEEAPPLVGGGRKAVSVARSSMGRDGYERAVRRIKEYVRAGDVFQVNVSQRFAVPFDEDPVSLYGALRSVNPSPYGGMLSFPGFAAVSSSPELLVRLSERTASTRPIAGTYPKEETEGPELLLDPKERAEHAMIVDLERNDLGRTAAYGTVRVEELMTTEAYSHVVHIVSEIAGELAPEKDPVDLLAGMFPGGTITGCPKVRCMEIIEELEPVRRFLYTGSFGCLNKNSMDMNIVIRTILLKAGVAYAQAGGGIVADSVPAREYRESLAKAAALLECLGASPP